MQIVVWDDINDQEEFEISYLGEGDKLQLIEDYCEKYKYTLEEFLQETSTYVTEEDGQVCGGDASQFKVEEQVFFMWKVGFDVPE